MQFTPPNQYIVCLAVKGTHQSFVPHYDKVNDQKCLAFHLALLIRQHTEKVRQYNKLAFSKEKISPKIGR
jgi:hypothetical protein